MVAVACTLRVLRPWFARALGSGLSWGKRQNELCLHCLLSCKGLERLRRVGDDALELDRIVLREKRVRWLRLALNGRRRRRERWAAHIILMADRVGQASIRRKPGPLHCCSVLASFVPKSATVPVTKRVKENLRAKPPQ